MDIFAQYAVNADAEENGVWIGNGDAEFLIARGNNPRFARMLTKQYEGNKQLLDLSPTATPDEIAASDALSNKITREVMSKAILLGWRGRDLGDGKTGKVMYKGAELPYSVENAQLLLTHKDFMAWVNGQSNSLNNYLISAQKAEEKNSVTTSSGTSPGEVASVN
jgi:hypothetical protein